MPGIRARHGRVKQNDAPGAYVGDGLGPQPQTVAQRERIVVVAGQAAYRPVVLFEQFSQALVRGRGAVLGRSPVASSRSGRCPLARTSSSTARRLASVLTWHMMLSGSANRWVSVICTNKV